MSRNLRFAIGGASSVLAILASLSACSSSHDVTAPELPPDAVTLIPGSTAHVVNGQQIELVGGSTGGEYLLVVTDTVTGATGTSSYQITTTGVLAPGSVSAPATSLAPPAGPSLDVFPRAAAPVLDIGFGMRLSERARPRLLPLFESARQTAAARRLAASSAQRSILAASAPSVGTIITYNVSDNACDAPAYHPARIMAVGTRAIVAADTLNPAGGFTTADYQRFAANFDTLVFQIDSTNFGAPSDIDQNGHVVILFTRAVNALTPPNSSFFVGGFFFDRDLFPKTATPRLPACAGSNEAEMFYMLAPDPNGAVNGNVRSRGFVDSLTTGVLGHEFQHLINAGRRIYVNNASDLEVVWLNEGLSHIAEELLFYRASGLSPRQNINANTLRGSQAAVNAFNAYQGSNVGRYDEYLKAPSTSSPIRDDDSLSTRGATWSFLRYAGDRKLRGGGTESDVWKALVNSQTVGIDNLRGVFATDVGGWIRDWSISHYTDDLVTSASADFTQPSWNWHSIYPALQGNPTYPLVVKPMSGASTTGTVIPGGAAFYRFAVPANTLAAVTLSGGTATTGVVHGTVVRVR